jgi:hypothetical protein
VKNNKKGMIYVSKKNPTKKQLSLHQKPYCYGLIKESNGRSSSILLYIKRRCQNTPILKKYKPFRAAMIVKGFRYCGTPSLHFSGKLILILALHTDLNHQLPTRKKTKQIKLNQSKTPFKYINNYVSKSAIVYFWCPDEKTKNTHFHIRAMLQTTKIESIMKQYHKNLPFSSFVYH